MNIQSNAPEYPVAPQGNPPAIISPTRPFYWSVRRELWENRSIYLAPLGVAAAFLFGYFITLAHLPGKMRGLAGAGPMQYRDAIAGPYDFAAGLMMVTSILVGFFYCVEALYGERRDRSILFWKSLPVSDLTTVLAKASVPIVIVPLFCFAVGVVTQFIMLLVTSLVLLGGGFSVAQYWTQLSLFQMSWLFLYHMATSHALWPAPIYAWLLLVSGWARRAVILWAVLPVVALSALEKIVFHTTYFAQIVGIRLIGAGAPAYADKAENMFPTNPMVHIAMNGFFSSPGFWLGLLFTAAFLALAVQMRRYREPI